MKLNEDGISLSSPVIMELIEAVHEKGASFRFQARGFSMTPAIRDNDVITISPLQDLMPRRGDVVAFRHPERPQMLVHRVLHGETKKYFIKGDNCPEADGWVPAENILGLITRVERRGTLAGGFAAFFSSLCSPTLERSPGFATAARLAGPASGFGAATTAAGLVPRCNGGAWPL